MCRPRQVCCSVEGHSAIFLLTGSTVNNVFMTRFFSGHNFFNYIEYEKCLTGLELFVFDANFSETEITFCEKWLKKKSIELEAKKR